MRLREYSVLFGLALIWGVSFLFIKIAVMEVSPATTVVLRLAFSVATLALIGWVRPDLVMGWRRFWKLGVVVGIINNAIPFVLISWGETQIASGVASILNATTPLFTVLLAHWATGPAHESLSTRRVGGVIMGFIGVAVLIGPAIFDLGGTGLARTLGEMAVLGAAAAYGVGAILSRRFGATGPLVAPMACQIPALLVMIPVAALWSPPTRMPSLLVIGSIAELGIMGTAVAYLLYFWLIRHVGATRTSLVTYLLPCTALLWGMMFLNERISWYTVLGLLLVLLGTMTTNGTLSGLFSRRAVPAATTSLSLD